MTPATFSASLPSFLIAAWSALVSGVPERAATMVILLVVRSPSSGAPSVCACTLGAPLARNRLGSLLTWLPSEGSATVAPTSATTQAAMTSSRNRTTPAARAAKNLMTHPGRRGRAGCPQVDDHADDDDHDDDEQHDEQDEPAMAVSAAAAPTPLAVSAAPPGYLRPVRVPPRRPSNRWRSAILGAGAAALGMILGRRSKSIIANGTAASSTGVLMVPLPAAALSARRMRSEAYCGVIRAGGVHRRL